MNDVPLCSNKVVGWAIFMAFTAVAVAWLLTLDVSQKTTYPESPPAGWSIMTNGGKQFHWKKPNPLIPGGYMGPELYEKKEDAIIGAWEYYEYKKRVAREILNNDWHPVP